MKLLIKPEGGMAGDMFAAALVSAGADFNLMREAMTAAGEKLGSTRIDLQQTTDGSSSLSIKLNSRRNHLGGKEAKVILAELFDTFDIKEKYRDFGIKILEILTKAEKRAHSEYHIVIEGDHDHSHSHSHEHKHGHSHHHPHSHNHDHEEGEETFLHEAQDIVIDIMGAVSGMQQLGVEPEARLLCPVSVGGGHVHCSHGTLSIPAPATSVILEQYRIQWKKGPIERELFTPTGAAILAALGSQMADPDAHQNVKIAAAGKSRGTKVLDIPPFELYIY